MRKNLAKLVLLLPLLGGCTTADKEFWKEVPKGFYDNLLSYNRQGTFLTPLNGSAEHSLSVNMVEGERQVMSYPLYPSAIFHDEEYRSIPK